MPVYLEVLSVDIWESHVHRNHIPHETPHHPISTSIATNYRQYDGFCLVTLTPGQVSLFI